jgi:hypothetical protein
MSDVYLRSIEPPIAIVLARVCGGAPAIAALLGRFLPRLGPLVATQAAFLFVCTPIGFSGSVEGVRNCGVRATARTKSICKFAQRAKFMRIGT